MSNVGLSMQSSPSGDQRPRRPKKAKKRSGAAVALAALVVAAVVGAVGYGAYFVYQKVQAAGPAEDYPGPGSGEVVVEVLEGQTLTDIGGTLKNADVVKTAEAFAEAAEANPEATSITPGSYLMLKQMAASDALDRLLDPAARNENVVTVVEGMRAKQVVAELADATGLPAADFEAVLRSPTKLPLPAWARGTGEARAEGFLFPATYQFRKDDTPQDMLRAMVAKFTEVTDEVNFESRARDLGYSPYEVLTVASLIQAEAHEDDFGKVSRVIYNRLSPKTWGGTFGKLELDATINYALDQFETNINKSDLDSNSPYNTRKRMGLPPTPINSPGEDALSAALDPPKGDWLWYATVNLDTGETKFTDNYDEFLRFQEELRQWEADNPQD